MSDDLTRVLQQLRREYVADSPVRLQEFLLVCRDDLAEEVVYEFTKEFFAALPMLATSNSEAALVDVEKAPATPIPLHSGAARYYREREVLK